MNESTAVHAKRLQDRGVRPTPQRLAVYEYLLTHRTHPSADAIYEALLPAYPSFSRTTIYNSLKALLQAGLIRVVTIDPFEQHFDGDTATHGHCRCSRCGTLLDFDVSESLLVSLAPDGFCIDRQDVFFTGVCKACQQQA